MPRVLRTPKSRRTEPVSESMWSWLVDESDGSGDVEVFLLNGNCARLKEAVGPMLPEILAHFVANHPGRRPAVWWKLRGEPRARLGGQGTAPWDCGLAYVPTFDRGIPSLWEDGGLWTSLGKVPPPSFVAFDPEDPPVFESEAAYLKRHELLLPGEAKRLGRADFEPEPIRQEEIEH